MLQIVASLTDNSRGVIYIYNRNMFIAKATGPSVTKNLRTQFTIFRDKLECSYLASLSSRV